MRYSDAISDIQRLYTTYAVKETTGHLYACTGCETDAWRDALYVVVRSGCGYCSTLESLRVKGLTDPRFDEKAFQRYKCGWIGSLATTA